MPNPNPLFVVSALLLNASVFGQSWSVDVDKELLITDLAVVEHEVEAMSPEGAFHVRTLLENMAPRGVSPKEVMLSFLGSLRAYPKTI